MLNVYADFHENELAIPVIKGAKTPKATSSPEPRTHTRSKLSCMTARRSRREPRHYFGDGFARAFGITYADKENKLVHPFQTSWGVTTRMIGGIIMTHGDDSGLVLPPAIAPIQVVIVPIAAAQAGRRRHRRRSCRKAQGQSQSQARRLRTTRPDGSSRSTR